MLNYVNWRLRVTINDSRTLVGTLLAFDKHMNLVLADTEEYRKVKSKASSEEQEQKRPLGLILLRGETVVSISAESPPAPKSRADAAMAAKEGPGVGKPAGRGVPSAAVMGAAPAGLAGPARGVGGPAPQMMMPQMQMGRGMPPMPFPGRGGPGMPMPPMPGQSK